MQCYSELLPPTAVTHAVALPFLSPDDVNLIVAKTSLLQVFRLQKPTDDDGDSKETRLLLVGEYQLSGTVVSLRRIHTLNSKTGADTLLVACRDAKLSLVEWDPENHRISTISIHYYEGETIPRQPIEPIHGDGRSILTVDPESRCAALKFWDRQLAILPFRQSSDELNELDGEIDADTRQPSEAQGTNGESAETPYSASFVVSLPSLDESLTDLVDLAFLHEYREPTFGILTSTGQASSALFYECKDPLTYHVLTLDLEQRASTILVSVEHLPVDLWKVIPLPLPVGGALLVGVNAFIHVAQSGKVHAVALNEFADLATSFTTNDQSMLKLKLEDCAIEQLDSRSGDLLIATNDGNLSILTFAMLGPDVKGVHVTPVTPEMGGSLVGGLPSCLVNINKTHLFIGSDEADSVLLAYKKQAGQLGRKRSHAEMLGKEVTPASADDSTAIDDESDEEEEDDLYATTSKSRQAAARATEASQMKSSTTYSFSLHDTLQSLGPTEGICFGRASRTGKGSLELVAPTGRRKGSRLAFMNKDITPNIHQSHHFEGTKSAWSLRAFKYKKGSKADHTGPDTLLFTSDGTVTKVYESPTSQDGSEAAPIERSSTEFEDEGETIDMGTLDSGRWIVQCRRTEVRTYDSDLGLSQIIPLDDEESEAELNIIHTSFADPYLLLIRSDGSLQVLSVDPSTHDVEPLEDNPSLAGVKWLSGSLYRGSLTNDETVAIMLKDDGSLYILSLPDLRTKYLALNPAHLPPVLDADAALRRIGYKETLTEVLLAEIGPSGSHKSYLIFRTAADDLILYEPFQFPSTESSWTANLKFRKVPTSYLPKYDEYIEENAESRVAPLKPLRLGNQHAVAVPGKPPSLILADASSRPKVLKLHADGAVSVVGVHQTQHPGLDSAPGFGLLSKDGKLQSCSLPAGVWIGTGWAVEKIRVADDQDETRHIAFHEERGMYVVATCRFVDFLFSEDDARHPDQDDISSRPQIPHYSLHLFSARTRRIINTYELPLGEAVTCLKVMPLEVSEHTHELKPLVVIGTASIRGEDMPAKGALSLFELLSVVPDPDDSETGVKLHLFSREEVKGAVTTAAPFGGGLVGIAQGQKIMVRGCKEDGSCLPVAFLDAQCQMMTMKTLGQSGIWLAGDSWKGVWLGGFTEDPYKLTFLGKSRTRMEVLCAEFLPFEGQLFVLVVDAEMDLHVLQYDPENPKTASGARLLHRSTFNLGHWPTSMTLVPSTLATMDDQALLNGHADDEAQSQPLYHILVTTQSGAMDLITPVDSGAYRRLGNLHGQMVSILEHAAALNPREYRAADGDTVASRGVIDGLLIQRIGELGSARRAEVLARCGSDAWTLRSDLEIIGGGGLGWL